MQRILLLALLIFLPIAHGGIEIWSVTVMHVVSIIIFAIWVFGLIKSGHIRLYRSPLDIPLLLLALYLVISLSLSVYPHASRIQIYRVINYMAIFYLLINTLRDRTSTESSDERRVVNFVSYLAIFGAIYGFAGLIFIGGNFLGFKVFSSGDFLSFTFRNHNHFAGYMNMIIWLCASMTIYYGDKRRLLFFALTLTSSMAVFLSLSRGGFLGFLGGLIFFSVLSVFYRKRNLFLISGVISLIIVVMLIHGSFDTVFDRMMTLQTPAISGADRLHMWKDVLNMIKDNLLTGTGIGTFSYAYPSYQTLEGWIIDHAHNEYLEIISETGLIGGGLLFLCIAILFGHVIRHSKSQPNSNLVGIGIGALSACFSLLVHEFFDFNFYIPSNALLFTVCAAIAVISSSISDKRSLVWCGIKPSGRGKIFYYSIAFIMGFISLGLVIAPYLGSFYQDKARNYQMSGNYKLAHESLRKAIFFNPKDAELLSSAGDLMILTAMSQWNDKDKELFLYESIKYYDLAIKNCPLKSYFYRRKAYSLRILGEFNKSETLLRETLSLNKSDYEIYLELAELYLEEGRLEDAINEFKEYVIKMNGVSYLIDVLDRLWDVTKDYNHLKNVVPKEARMIDAFANYLWNKGMQDDAVKEFARAYEYAPSVERALTHIQFLKNTQQYSAGYMLCKKYLNEFNDNIQLHNELAWFSERIGKYDEAISTYGMLINLDPKNSISYRLSMARIYCERNNPLRGIDIINMLRETASQEPELYHILAGCYDNIRRYDLALDARKKAVLLNPNNSDYLFHIGFNYRANGLREKAIESWRECLRVNPSHKGCREWVEKYEDSYSQ